MEYDKIIRDIADTVKEPLIALAASIDNIQENQWLLLNQMNELSKEVRSIKCLDHGFEWPLKTLSYFTEFENNMAIDVKRAENSKTHLARNRRLIDAVGLHPADT